MQLDFLLTSTKKRSAPEKTNPVAAKKTKLESGIPDRVPVSSIPTPPSLASVLLPDASFPASTVPASALTPSASNLRAGPVCRPCQKHHLMCNNDAPCSHREQSGQVCLYLPCPWGIFCENATCGYLHRDQKNPWDSRSTNGNGMAKFFEQFHKQVKSLTNVSTKTSSPNR